MGLNQRPLRMAAAAGFRRIAVLDPRHSPLRINMISFHVMDVCIYNYIYIKTDSCVGCPFI